MIRWIKRSLRGVKLGHSGTLDPLASGLMIILLGRATKTQDSFMKLGKTYRFSMKLGIQTDSGDLAGQKILEAPVPPLSSEQILSVLTSFTGTLTQIPPMYSALKKNGVPLYKWARKGEVVERTPRTVVISELSLLSRKSEDEIELRVQCSSGTYVRTLAEDLGKALGTCAVMTGLVREKIGDYSVENAVAGEKLSTLTADQFMSLVQRVAGSK